MTAIVGGLRPLSEAILLILLTRALKVGMEIRPGIHPSQYSTARRAEAGVAPQYQYGGGPPTGLGSIVTSLKL
jgi:hypothetical protein